MATRDEVLAFQVLRARFLEYLYDNEDAAQTVFGVQAVHAALAGMGLPDLSPGSVARLVRALEQAGLIHGMGQTYGDSYSPEVALTASGREEVEAWITAGTSTMEHIPVSHQQVYNTNIEVASGSAVTIGSGNAVSSVIVKHFDGGELEEVLRAATKFLRQDSSALSADQQEEFADDIALLGEQVAATEPNRRRVRRIVKRLGVIAESVGASAAGTALLGTIFNLGA